MNASFTITSLLLTLGSFLVTFSLGGWEPSKSMRDRSFSPYIIIFSTGGNTTKLVQKIVSNSQTQNITFLNRAYSFEGEINEAPLILNVLGVTFLKQPK